MISIGDFQFPAERTSLQVIMIEAKSKVRKEIQIRSYIHDRDIAKVDQSIKQLQSAVESFDCFESVLSLQPGRFYKGRRRNFQVIKIPNKSAVWVDLLILTDDRFERSIDEHQIQKISLSGITEFELINGGNWKTPLIIEIQPSQLIESVIVTFDQQQFSATNLEANTDTIVINSIQHSVTQGSKILTTTEQKEFPYLPSGTNQITINTTPISSEMQCIISYRDVWV